MDRTDTPYAGDKAFWDRYIKGRPQPPQALFGRIYPYHASHGGALGTVHDAGAGMGPYSPILKQKFSHVIVSDIVPGNVDQAKARLGTDGYSYRAAGIEDASNIPPGSVDLVFATQVIHFVDLEAAQKAFARQLKPGGSLIITGFGIAHYEHDDVQDIFSRLRKEGTRVLVRHSAGPEAAKKRLKSLSRVQNGYVSVPFDEKYFLPGAQRITLNPRSTTTLPSGDHTPAIFFDTVAEHLQHLVPHEPSAMGPNDIQSIEQEAGWDIETDLEGLKQQWSTYAMASMEPGAYEPLWREMEEVMKDGRRVKGWWPAKILMVSRR